MESFEPNTRFTFLKDNLLETTTFQDLLQNRRVLVCSITRPLNPLTDRYIQYLNSKKEEYKKFNVDVYFVYSSHTNLLLARYGHLFPDNSILHDVDKSFVTQLAAATGNTQSQDILTSYWTYQALFDNGQLVQFYEQPTSNQLKKLVTAVGPNSDRLGVIRHMFRHRSEDLIFFRQGLEINEQSSEDFRFMFYYNMWPNTKLEKFLVDSKSST